MSISRAILIIAIGFFLLSASRGVAFFLVDRSPRPRLQVTPSEFDLGTVAVGQPVERTFLIHNAGSARLLITDVKSTCQCTVAELPSRAVIPSGSTTLRVTFDAKSAGARVQSVALQSNDPDEPVQIVKLRAHAVVAVRP